MCKTRDQQEAELNHLHKMYNSCLRRQNNAALMFSGAAQSKEKPQDLFGFRVKIEDAEPFKREYQQLDKACEQYRQDRDELFHMLHGSLIKTRSI
ncbi:MAG TPA: hypothetical protein VHM20_00240 [Gammaproteobacteria bacterium]|nr:hypothetical protein [Gammaproteobacteria bacterium]